MSQESLRKKPGPKTASGKKSVSLNALKHGFSARREDLFEFSPDVKSLADILVGTNKNAYVFELAMRVAEAQFEIIAIRKKMVEAFEKIRKKYLPITLARQNVKNYIKLIEATVPDVFLQVDLATEYVDQQTSPYILDESASFLEALKEIEKLERYLRSSMNRRKRAMRELSEFKK